MNSTTQAQKGFKTFILTLVVSLLVFSTLYVLINNDTSAETLGVANSDSPKAKVEGSVFEELANKQVSVEPKEVLAGADEADVPETTVPDTGVSGPTLGILFSTVLLVVAWYLNTKTQIAFEKKVLKELD